MIRRAAALAASLTLFAAPVAMADTPVPHATVPGAVLELSVTNLSGYTYSADLTCLPTGGTHSNPWSACDALKVAKGDLDNLAPQDWRACTREYSPVILSAKGHWKGDKVAWSKAFGNECEAHRQTSGLFDF